MTLSFQEMVSKCDDQITDLKRVLGDGTFHPEAGSIIYGTRDHPQKPALTRELQEAYHKYSLAEFLAKSGTTGIAGAAYLVPDKLWDTLIMYSKQADIVPLISAYVAEQWAGGDLKVDAIKQYSFKPKKFSSGGVLATSTPEIGQGTISPISFGLPILMTNDLVEDKNWDMIEFQSRQAGIAMGEYASELALIVLKTATDGFGAVNGGASGDADETKWAGAGTTGIDTCLAALSDDRWIADTIIITTEAWEHSVYKTMPTLASNIPWQYTMRPPTEGFNIKIGIPPLDVLFCNSDALHDGGVPSTAMTSCVTIVYNRRNALVTGRKRWMQIESYANPIADLDGAVVTCRQDSITINDDAVAVITET